MIIWIILHDCAINIHTEKLLVVKNLGLLEFLSLLHLGCSLQNYMAYHIYQESLSLGPNLTLLRPSIVS